MIIKRLEEKHSVKTRIPHHWCEVKNSSLHSSFLTASWNKHPMMYILKYNRRGVTVSVGDSQDFL